MRINLVKEGNILRTRKIEVQVMKFTASTIVSNSDMIKNYKSCRMKADSFGKIIILKNNQPDAVLFSITEYERLSGLIEYAEGISEQEINRAVELLSNAITH